MQRLKCLEEKCLKNNKLSDEYSAKIDLCVDKGYAIKLIQDETIKESPRTWYLPHFPIIIWQKWLEELKGIPELRIPRCYSRPIPTAKRIGIHTFPDSSKEAFAAVSYLSVIKNDDEIETCISPRRQADPLKPLSIPRLELQGAVMASRLCEFIENIKRKELDRYEGDLTMADLNEVENMWIKKSHCGSFMKELNQVKNTKSINKNSRLNSLSPQFENDVLVLGERTHLSTSLEDKVKKSIICPKHEYTKLLIEHYHSKFCHRDSLRKGWKKLQQLVDMFWTRKVKEYLPTWTKRIKWSRDETPLNLDDVVIIVDDTAPRYKWKLGRVFKVFPGPDGKVRVVDVTSAEEFRRPVNKLFHKARRKIVLLAGWRMLES